MTGRRGNPLVLRKILPNPDLVIASTGADIGFYIVSLVGQVIIIVSNNKKKTIYLKRIEVTITPLRSSTLFFKRLFQFVLASKKNLLSRYICSYRPFTFSKSLIPSYHPDLNESIC